MRCGDILPGTRYYVPMKRQVVSALAHRGDRDSKERILRRRIMNKRLVWLAPIALAALLSGCSVTVTTTGPIAPDSLVGYTLVFSHDRESGVLLAHSERLHFKSAQRAINASLDDARNWTYSRDSHDSATVSVTFGEAGSVASRVTCDLTFDDRREGTHECEHVHSATFAFVTFSSEGSTEGTFVLRPIGSDGP